MDTNADSEVLRSALGAESGQTTVAVKDDHHIANLNAKKHTLPMKFALTCRKRSLQAQRDEETAFDAVYVAMQTKHRHFFAHTDVYTDAVPVHKFLRISQSDHALLVKRCEPAFAAIAFKYE